MKRLGSLNINPCPVCGEEDFSFYYELHISQGLPLRLYCNYCFASTPPIILPQDIETRKEAENLAIELWNKGNYIVEESFVETQEEFKENIRRQIRKLK